MDLPSALRIAGAVLALAASAFGGGALTGTVAQR